jgi:hypothetical protein
MQKPLSRPHQFLRPTYIGIDNGLFCKTIDSIVTILSFGKTWKIQFVLVSYIFEPLDKNFSR